MSRRFVVPALALAGLLMAVPAAAQDAKGQAPVPPPPGIDDPGVQVPPAPITTVLPPASAAPASSAARPASSGEETDALGEPPPTVDVRKVGANTVEEYRISGRLYMIHVIPEHGIPQTYLANPEGHLYSRPGQPPVSPVFYTIYTWDKPSKPAESNSSGN